MVTISLCMIVKNEENVLKRVLGQMKGIVDEIIVVDTGSTDQTKKIVTEYADQVYDFIWRDDFAAARNFACEKATMDYWMWLDADDVITDAEREKAIFTSFSYDVPRAEACCEIGRCRMEQERYPEAAWWYEHDC